MMVLKAEDFWNSLLQFSENKDHFDQVIVPTVSGSGYNYSLLYKESKNDAVFNPYRTNLPARYFFYFPREKVYPVNAKFPKRLIAGFKACDLKALELLDTALKNQNFNEPVYSKWRESTTVISSDCTGVNPSCGCSLFNNNPFPVHGYDVNISLLNGDYLLRPGSEKGEQLLSAIGGKVNFRLPVPQDLDIINFKRDEIINILRHQNEQFVFDDNSDLRKSDSSGWKDESKECIGCGACTNACPTCYCIILNDESTGKGFVKARSYDSCQWFGYARVAGGGTPRPKMHERFRNRYLCKMDYMKNNFNTPGCTGCGRCTEACAAGIDFRGVLSSQLKTPAREYEKSL